MTKNKITILVVVIILSLAVALSFIFQALGSANKDNYKIKVTDASGSVRFYSFVEDGVHNISSNLGDNSFEIKNGEVRMLNASCANQDCMHQKAVTKDGFNQIICLPNKVIIEKEISDSQANVNSGTGDIEIDALAN